MTGPNGTTYFGYDELGRMTSKTRGSFTATYTWDYDSRLVDVASDFPDEGNVEYAYGGDGKRRQRVAGTDETWYNWGAGYTVMGEEDGSNNLERTYVGGTMAHIDGANPATGTYAYYWHDHLASTRALYDGTKNQDAESEYSPYGDRLYASNANATDRLYTGHDWDAASQLYFAPFRYYGSDASQWMSRDPLGMVDGTNLYYYSMNAPSMYNDPLGLLPPAVVAILQGGKKLLIGGGIGAGLGGLSHFLRCGTDGLGKAMGIGALSGAFVPAAVGNAKNLAKVGLAAAGGMGAGAINSTLSGHDNPLPASFMGAGIGALSGLGGFVPVAGGIVDLVSSTLFGHAQSDGGC